MDLPTVYIGRGNTVTLELLQDGKPPARDVITSVELFVPGEAFETREPVTVDTNGPEVSLINDATAVELALGDLAVIPGRYLCYVTVYDGASADGIAWDSIGIEFATWI